MSSSTITDSIREVNENTWVIGETLLLSRQTSPSPASWSDGKGLFFTISQVSSPPPQTRPIDDKSVIQLIHNVAGKSAVWRIGEAYCKVKAVEYTGCTLEHTTLHFVQEKGPIAFKVPSVIYHKEHHGRYFLIQSRMDGETIAEAWWSMDEKARDVCVNQMVSVCKELASWKGDAICGVDGLHLSEERLASGKEPDMSPEALLKNCKALGMDCSSFSFYHCDMGPGNVILDRTNGAIGIIDWETAGYVPKEWIRTKFRVSMGLNLPDRDDDSKNDWRRRIQAQLGKEGFDDVAGAWMVWSESPTRQTINNKVIDPYGDLKTT